MQFVHERSPLPKRQNVVFDGKINSDGFEHDCEGILFLSNEEKKY